MSSDQPRCLVLRLAAPLQAWGRNSQFNRRETANEPTKSGIVGLLAAAEGLRREDPIVHLVNLRMGIRSDRPGSLLRDYHTVSDSQNRGLPTASVNAKGRQKRRPSDASHITERYYLQDAVFVAAVEGGADLLLGLADAVRSPYFPLALGRRSCPPTQPMLLMPADGPGPLWTGSVHQVLEQVPWQADPYRATAGDGTGNDLVRLMATVDHPAGDDVVVDVPTTFSPLQRGFAPRRVTHLAIDVPAVTAPEQSPSAGQASAPHDPFALLGW